MGWKLAAASSSHREGCPEHTTDFDDRVEGCSAEKGLAVLLQGIAQSRETVCHKKE
jgi:hypothetical protein